VKVFAYDIDPLLSDELLGNATTDTSGNFTITYTPFVQPAGGHAGRDRRVDCHRRVRRSHVHSQRRAGTGMDWQPWSMYGLTISAGKGAADEGRLLAPALAKVQEGDPLEEVKARSRGKF
jgi:hypothetical protein